MVFRPRGLFRNGVVRGMRFFKERTHFKPKVDLGENVLLDVRKTGPGLFERGLRQFKSGLVAVFEEPRTGTEG